MINKGAYSKKYQAMDKEKIREYKERERKYHKERTHILSLQTAQRQRVIEGKKRAMAAAEEERRRKALEDRRRSQKQATDLFRSVVGRIRSTSGLTGHNIGTGINLPGSAKPKTARCSHPYQNQVQVIPLESRFQVQYKNHDVECNERLALGKEVEIGPRRIPTPAVGLRRKTPSLDDVSELLKVSGSSTDTSQNKVHMHANSLDSYSRGSATNFNGEENIKHKSSSDRSLSQNRNHVQSNTQKVRQLDHGNNNSSIVEDCEITVLQPVNEVPENELASLHEVAVVSPDNCTVLQEDHPSDSCNTPTIPDSLNSSIVESVPLNAKLNSTPKAFEDVTVNYNQCQSSADDDKQDYDTSEECVSHLMFTCGEGSDVSVSDSLEDVSLQSKFHSLEVSQKNASDNMPKIVGILKKMDQSSSNPSCMNYPISSGVKKALRFGNDRDGTQIGGKNSSKLRKRVHFSDQVEANDKKDNLVANNTTDSVQFELWKKIFPLRSLPNSAFTTRMKCSLSTTQGHSRLVKRPMGQSTINGVSVHVPATSTVEESLSPKHNDIDSLSTKTDLNNGGLEINDVTYDVDQDSADGRERERIVDKSPTDAEINQMWDQIRQCLREGRKVSVPPRLFNFKPPTDSRGRINTNTMRIADQSGSSSTDSFTATLTNARILSSKASNPSQSTAVHKNGINHTTQQQLVYRQQQQSRMIRYHSDSHSQPVSKCMQYVSAMRDSSAKSNVHPNIQSSSKGPLKSSMNSGNKVLPTSLSLEEQKLMQSIERINQRIKDHFVQSTSLHSVSTSEYNYPVPPPTPPKRNHPHPPVNGRIRELNNPPKYGLHHPPPPRLVNTNYRPVNLRTTS